MNNYKRACTIRIFLYLLLAAFCLGACTVFYLQYAELNFKLVAVSTGLVAVMVFAGNGIGEEISELIRMSRIHAFRRICRVTQSSRHDFS
ncbi:hypothetical protein YOLOSWAG_265 [Erwinia phage vB_EamM_Yoloswag]|uniref:Uncharacterized protein n=1 Tax=Erwinia phage vB_EamM_Yoloswag TaxID=1958956 RepID=A0A1S6L3I2_9CAUD|nr:hypothetical protein HOR66_gp265 [Erwinia phage vB_EamM_Yoloswag]AQT28738.1 hypothetical protein YOLOSWAG_265 [Erwinia phage vB_EamM_Yoloswag]